MRPRAKDAFRQGARRRREAEAAAFSGSGPASDFTASSYVDIPAWGVVRPSGEVIGENNWAVWDENQTGLTFQCETLPAPLPQGVEVYWTLEGLPEGEETKIRWEPWDVANNRPHVGVGASPVLKVTYENPQSAYTDFMPPDNSWFGQKTIRAQAGYVAITRPVWFFFNPLAMRTLRQGGKQEAAWFRYWKDSGAVPALADFEYDASLQHTGLHTWSSLAGDKYYVGFKTQSSVGKSVFDVNVTDSYTEIEYPGKEGKGIHAVAKTCGHELWHGTLKKETRRVWRGGLGHPDGDGDGLSDAREAEIGTKPGVKDTCGLSGYKPEYIDYAGYADQELFCRWKEISVSGDASKDWSAGGAQAPDNNE